MKKILLFAMHIFLLAACSSAPKVDLTGEWRLVSYGDAAKPTPAFPGTGTTIQFENGQVSGNVGCNSFSGSYELKSGALVFGPIMSTMMFCEETSAQEQGVLAVFANGVRLNISRNGDVLTIASPDGLSVVNLARK